MAAVGSRGRHDVTSISCKPGGVHIWLDASRGSAIADYAPALRSPWRAAVDGETEPVALPLAADNNGVLRADRAPLLPVLMDRGRTPAERAAMFHTSLAQALVEQAKALRETHGEFTVGFSGGVFQHSVLTERARALLAAAGFDTRLGQQLPCNDAGISYGQIIETASR